MTEEEREAELLALIQEQYADMIADQRGYVRFESSIGPTVSLDKSGVLPHGGKSLSLSDRLDSEGKVHFSTKRRTSESTVQYE